MPGQFPYPLKFPDVPDMEANVIMFSSPGLMGEMIYAPYDLTGIKFLWWTWHDTDAPVSQRIMGVPVGSTVWVITFTASFQVILLIRSAFCLTSKSSTRV